MLTMVVEKGKREREDQAQREEEVRRIRSRLSRQLRTASSRSWPCNRGIELMPLRMIEACVGRASFRNSVQDVSADFTNELV